MLLTICKPLKFSFMKRKLPLSCLFALLFSASGAFAQNPVAPAQGFNVFTQTGANLIDNQTEGPVAVGGDLTIGGVYNVSTAVPGSFTVHGVPVSLVVGGRVNYGTGLLTVNQNGYVKIGDCTGSAVWYTDMSGSYSPIRITSASDYGATPRINMVVTAADLGVSGSVNPVNQTDVIDFPSAFALMQANATDLAGLSDNADITDSIGNVLSSHTGLPGNIVINLHSGVNILNINASDLNNIHQLAYGVHADASHVLIVNVNAPGAFTWNVCNQSGAGFAEASYILYNFHNCTTLNVEGSGAIEGTVFAPGCDVHKTVNTSVIEGQVVCHSFHHGAGQCHHAPFHPSIDGCGVGSINTVASYDVCSYNECLSGNIFVFNGSAVGVGPFTYHWNFGDRTTSTAKNPIKVYSATGTYNVWFKATGAGGADSIMHTLVVNPDPVHDFTVNDSIQQLTGNSFAFTSATPSTGNTYSWDFGDGTHSTAINPTKTYSSIGGYVVAQQVTHHPGGCTFTSYHKVRVICDSVSGGGGGGLESVSLGDLVSRRTINNVKNSVNTKNDYNKMPVFHKGGHSASRTTSGYGNTIQRFTPASLDASTTPKISTPTDITSLTSAVDVFSVDYENNNLAKAVVLAITTTGKPYNHTKSICDRFRGAKLLSTDIVEIQGNKFIEFALQQQNGTIEYCIAFSAGKSAGSSHFNLQSKWLISEYSADDSVFNFQVWAASPEHTEMLAKDILANLAAVMPVQQVDNNLIVPSAYIAAGKRDKGFLNLAITSTEPTANSKIIFEERRNENSGVDSLVIPFTIGTGTANNFNIPIYDGYEYQGHLYVNDTLVDDIYMADGNWSLDADPGASMKPDNNFSRVYVDGEYPLYRNVTLTGNAIGYASVWKFVTSGEDKVDLSAYHSFKFLAKGEGKVRITLVRDGITNWNDQFYTTMELDATGTKNYQVSFDDFASDNLGSVLNAGDVTAVVYTFQYKDPTNMTFFADNQAFSTTVVPSVTALHSKKVSVMPNPANGPFQCRFGAEQDEDLTLELTDVAGRVAYRQAIHAVQGINNVKVNVPAELNGAMFIMKLSNGSVKYDVTKVTLVH